MKIVTVVENTAVNESFQAEHGLCLYIETPEHKLLFDTGQTDLFQTNMEKLGIDPASIDTVVLSHGHYDHGGGLMRFSDLNNTADIYIHEGAFGDFFAGDRYIGINKDIKSIPRVTVVPGDMKIDDELFVFSGITGRRCWPTGNKLLKEKVRGELVQDSFRHEQCLVVSAEGKKILIGGCAHNGILNILDRYREIFGSDPDIVISGFHMMKREAYTDEEARLVRDTAEELKKMTGTMFYTGHCTGNKAFVILKEIMGDQLGAIHTGETIVDF
ncbi:MAG: MBL fold metallo-hydrolase [Eubacteriales bacterium]|nr:MBL fold metallo-hydrolase [Eubacteriales bacterium]